MRKVTQEACRAFMCGYKFNGGNTQVLCTVNGNYEMYLHGNMIARRNGNMNTFEITLAGWETVTTRDRLNGLPGVSVCQRKGEQFLNGKPWNGEWITV